MAATPAPVSVVTTMDENGPAGCTVSAFMSLSLSPRMVAVALDRRSSVLARIESVKVLGINLLAASQSEMALQFASLVGDRFAGLSWFVDGAVPRLHGTAAWLRCNLESVVDAGDHALLMAEVLDAASSPVSPMVYAERLFGGHSKLQDRPVPPMLEHVAACAR